MAIVAVFSTINPGRAVDTPLSLFKKSEYVKELIGREMIHLFANPLPAILALHCMFDDRISRQAFIETGNSV